MRNILLCVAAVLAAPLPAVAAPPLPALSGDTAHADARSLAEIVAPRETMISMNLDGGRQAMLELPKLDPDAKTFEEEYPGIHAAMWAAVEGEMKRQLEAELPELWSRLEQAYLALLTPSELRAVLTFYRTATGQRMIKSMYANANLQPMIESMAKSEDGNISRESMLEVDSAARAKAVAEANIEESDVLPMIRAVSLDRLQAVGRKAQEITMAWVNEEDSTGQAKINKLMADAAEQFMESHEAPTK